MSTRPTSKALEREPTRLPEPTAGNGEGPVVKAVRRALIAVTRDGPAGQVVPVDVLRTRIEALVVAQRQCDHEKMGRQLPALIRDLYTSLAAGQDVEKLLAMAVLLHVPELDSEAGERLTRQLRAELVELDIESVDLAADGSAPDGAKGTDPVTLGAIIVALSASGGVFTALIETLRDWLGRHGRRHQISVTIDGDTLNSSGPPPGSNENSSMPTSAAILASSA